MRNRHRVLGVAGLGGWIGLVVALSAPRGEPTSRHAVRAAGDGGAAAMPPGAAGDGAHGGTGQTPTETTASEVVPEPGTTGRDLAPPRATWTAAALHESTLRDMQELYAEELRTEPWATEREAAIRDYTLADIQRLDPAAEVRFDCRSSSCRIRIYSTNQHLTEEMGDYPFACMAKWGTSDLGMAEGERRYADFYVLFGEDNLTVDAFGPNRDLTCPRYRAIWLEAVQRPFAVSD
ncbi:MAG: hypothetical protein KBG28_25730 [Kofleriaceae bacterium]|jgi:hypothetical protein|nr:hypothetical protein [Kofleriaceae bacterium]MBP6840015.1 hypothetical protein [Kofleriaceae bacterium]MBP9207397.1 hypothetical protein [Kofleriaceae bacterium]